jgi:hypothetical protein
VQRQLGGKAVQRHRLQMIVRFDARQQRRDRDGAISHVLLVGHIIFDGQGLYLRVLEQFLGLPV